MERLFIRDCNVFNPSGPTGARSILIEDGKIAKLSKEPRDSVSSDVSSFDARGATVLPGLIDTHCHLVSLGSMRRILDLTGSMNLTTFRLRTFAQMSKLHPGEWLIGRGWDQEAMAEQRYPTKEDIDDLTPQNPALLTRVCGHVALLNSRAMKELGIVAKSSETNGLLFERDTTGNLTGIIKERVLEEVSRKIHPWSLEMVTEDILAGEHEAARNGLTTLHCILSSNYLQELEAFTLLQKDEMLALRYRIYLPVEALDLLERAEFDEMNGAMFKVAGVKVFADGSLGGRTAALEEPYDDDPGNSGILRYDDAELESIVRRADSAGCQVLIHAIGDAAISQAIKAIERGTDGKNERRHRIEHGSLCNDEAMRRLKEGSIGVTVQPLFVVSDTWAGARLGERRLRWLYPFNSLLRNGVEASGGSDAPVESISPLLGMWAAMVRASYSPRERLTIQEAVRLYTRNAAHNGFDENTLGEVREGFRADLTILDSDIRDMHPAMVRKVGVAATIVDGKIVYSYEGTM